RRHRRAGAPQGPVEHPARTSVPRSYFLEVRRIDEQRHVRAVEAVGRRGLHDAEANLSRLLVDALRRNATRSSGVASNTGIPESVWPSGIAPAHPASAIRSATPNSARSMAQNLITGAPRVTSLGGATVRSMTGARDY